MPPTPSRRMTRMGEKSERKYYRRVFTVTMLCDEPIGDNWLDVEHIEAIYTGPASGGIDAGPLEEIDGPTMAGLLKEQGSDPGFLGLTDDGKDADGEDDHDHEEDPDDG
jgi:hypothetical protein